MGKLSNIILNENIRGTGVGPVGDQTGVILGNKVYKVKKAKTEGWYGKNQISQWKKKCL